MKAGSRLPAAVRLGRFIAVADVPAPARSRAASAVLDTVGVTLAGSVEPAARLVQEVAAAEGAAPCCRVLGTDRLTGPSWAALANGTAAHALDYDDMCFVSLAHPSAPLVAALLACGELTAASGRSLLEAYVIGFEIEAALGRAMNPSHYERGWHCTSTIGTAGAAAAAARVQKLDADGAARCLSIAASQASGLKESFGTMTKPLHAGLAARNGVMAAALAARGFTAAETALDGAQGLLAASGGRPADLDGVMEHLGGRWEILETGITVKKYPSCAATHPAIDALLDMRREYALRADEIETVRIGVDAFTPGVLIHDRPATGLEAKFSMPYCAAAALADGRVGIDSFEPARASDPAARALAARVTMHVDRELDERAPALTQAFVEIRLRDGRRLTRHANGSRPAEDAELAAKFLDCAGRVSPPVRAEEALACLARLERLDDVRRLTALLAPSS